MNTPILFATDVIGDGSAITIGLGIGLLAVGLAWGQATMQISSLREWQGKATAENEALGKRITAVEVRESRTVERIDNLVTQLGRIEKKLDELLERRGVVRDVA